MGRMGSIEELAHLTIFLMGDGCDYLTGQTIAMDGGQMLAGPGTFASLTSMTKDDWAEARAKSQACQRSGQDPARCVTSRDLQIDICAGSSRGRRSWSPVVAAGSGAAPPTS